MLTRAASPSDWAAADLPRLFRDDLHAPEPGLRRRITLPELLADDFSELRRLHQRLVADGATPQAASHYLVGWYPGLVAAAVGFGLATARAGIIFRAAELIFDVVTDGWPESLRPVELSAVVAAGHPWAGQPRVTTVSPEISAAVPASVAAAAGTALIELVEPFVVACQTLARTRVASLWNEVADGLGQAVAHQRHLVVTQQMLDDLDTVLSQPAVPWNRRPRLGWASSPTLGAVHVAQKDGCCLAFTERPGNDAAPPQPEPDVGPAADIDLPAGDDLFTAHVEAYRQQFPEHLDVKRYCSTCRFRDPVDVDRRQIFWAHHRPSS